MRVVIRRWLQENRGVVPSLIGLLILLVHVNGICTRPFVPVRPDSLARTGFAYGGEEKQPSYLPANALGALFITQAQLSPSDFDVSIVNGSQDLRVKIVPLKRLASAAKKTHENLEDPSERMYRIEPTGGFKSGETYLFKYKGGATNDSYFVKSGYFSIDPWPFDFSKVRIRRIGEPNREIVESQGRCPHSPYGVAIVQVFKIDGPRNWQRYRQNIFALLTLSGRAWHVPDSLNSYPIQLDSSDYRARQMLENQSRYVCVSDLDSEETETVMTAKIAFLEIDSGWHQSRAVTFRLTKSEISQLDSLDFLRAATASGQTSNIIATLNAIPLRATDEAAEYPVGYISNWLYALPRYFSGKKAFSRRATLHGLVKDLSRHLDPAVRRAAQEAAQRLASHPLRIETAEYRE